MLRVGFSNLAGSIAAFGCISFNTVVSITELPGVEGTAFGICVFVKSKCLMISGCHF